MRQLGKFFKIYCSENHRKWPELLPHTERWVNQSVSESTGYAAIELMEGTPKPDLLRNVLTKDLDQLPQEESGH
jgi:hypothetical protein